MSTPNEQWDAYCELVSRKTSTTSKQMLNAPKNAYYIWPVGASRFYAEDLASALARPDLEIITQDQFSHCQERYLQLKTRKVVIDHACFDFKLTPAFHDAIRRARAYGMLTDQSPSWFNWNR